jgi:hypothetical protein
MSRWDVETLRKMRRAYMRKARTAQQMARETTGATHKIWREHGRQHVKAARRENWLLVGNLRHVSAAFFLRKTIGADMRARVH